jgi:hypothetical protein
VVVVVVVAVRQKVLANGHALCPSAMVLCVAQREETHQQQSDLLLQRTTCLPKRVQRW